ncbi:hypothetical protein KSP40_PGU019150 [Platanthera guangdongensis]|uniref:Uncharacterized protein n=1 Tax=Platanthera guangdongensis TaxID=2320717 RepID=A0ABR2M6V3_9ASPA
MDRSGAGELHRHRICCRRRQAAASKVNVRRRRREEWIDPVPASFTGTGSAAGIAVKASASGLHDRRRRKRGEELPVERSPCAGVAASVETGALKRRPAAAVDKARSTEEVEAALLWKRQNKPDRK